jgi:replicative DNA helicase
MALNLAAAALGAGVGVLFVSLEMSRHQLLTRLLAIVTNSDITSLERGPHYREADYQTAAAAFVAMQATHGATLTILDRPSCDWPTLATHIARGIEAGAGLVILDYLQLVTMPGADGVYETTRQVSAAVRRLAVERNVTTLALSQFNRATTFNGNKESPTMHGMAGGSALENDADQVALLDQSDVEYTPRGKRITVKLDKNRHGPLVKIPVVWDPATLNVREAAPTTAARPRYNAGADSASDEHEQERVRV